MNSNKVGEREKKSIVRDYTKFLIWVFLRLKNGEVTSFIQSTE